MQINDWFKTASATFVGGAIAIGLVAIPTFVWLPREFDDIKTKVDAALAEASVARVASEEAKSASLSTLQGLDGLVVSIAKMDSTPIFDPSIKGYTGDVLFAGAGEKILKFNELFPPDVLEMIQASGLVASFEYSNFGGKDWVFVSKAQFNQFSSEDQSKIEEALSRYSTRFIVE
jgi:hypothetical protein